MNKKTMVIVIGLVLSLSMINISTMIIPVKAAVNISAPKNTISINPRIVNNGGSMVISKTQTYNSINNNEDPIYNLLIIAPQKFAGELQPLVDHKNNLDPPVKTILVKTSEIYDGDYFPVQGRDKPEKIKYFIKNAYDEWGIKYVLLVGMDIPGFRDLPVRYCYNSDIGTGFDELCFISDLYYADICDSGGNFSSWDTDNDGIFGEWYMNEPAEDNNIDLYPDVYVGRLPCKFKSQVKATVNKIIKYETTTYGQSWFKNIIGVSGDTYPDGTWYTADGTTSWSYDWDTTQQDDGRNITDGYHVIYARSYNGEDYSDYGFVKVYVNNSAMRGGDYIRSFDTSEQSYAGNGLPTVEITYPEENEIVSGIVTITGTASGDVTLVELAIDGGGWHFPTPGYEGEENVCKVLGNMSTIGFNPTYLFVSDGTFTEPKDIRREVNKGAGFLFLDGHSCPANWACKDENGWYNGIGLSDGSAYLFSNREKLPVCIWGGCHTFQFDVGAWKIFSDPDYKPHVSWVWECIGWSVVRLPWGGAIAAIGCTALGLTKEDRDDCWKENGTIPTEGNSDFLDPQFFFRYINDGGSSSGSDVFLGEIMGKTVSDYLDYFPINWSQGATNDSADDAKTVQQWVLFGDPSLKIGGYTSGGSGSSEVEVSMSSTQSTVSGYVGVSMQFQASASGGTGSYVYSWQFEDGQLNYNTGETAGCTWYSPGVYQATVKVTDTNGEECTYDTFVNIGIKPNAPSGPRLGKIGVEYTFTAHITGSPSQDHVCYIFDWGDGTFSDLIGPYTTKDQTVVEAKHVWRNTGTYQIRVKAWLINSGEELFEETGWSDPLSIDVTGKVFDMIVSQSMLQRLLCR